MNIYIYIYIYIYHQKRKKRKLVLLSYKARKKTHGILSTLLFLWKNED